MYLLALSARHVVLSLPPSQDYNLATQIGQAVIYALAHPADFHAMSSFCSVKTSRPREILFILRLRWSMDCRKVEEVDIFGVDTHWDKPRR